MTRRGHEIKIHLLQYVFTTRLLARFHYVFSGFSRSRWDFSGQNEFLPTQHRLASYLNVPLVIGDATSLTEAGYVGDDVESLLSKLIQTAEGDMDAAQRGIVFIDEIDKINGVAQASRICGRASSTPS